jgi:hypothetical protein
MRDRRWLVALQLALVLHSPTNLCSCLDKGLDGLITFDLPLFEASVQEEADKPLLVKTITASAVTPDKKGEPAASQYRLSSLIDARSQEFFSIEKATGAISTVSKLDREFMDTHYLEVAAVDTTSQHTATTTLVVHVVDINDNAPIFEQSVYNASVHELTPIGTPVVSVLAHDRDAGENGRLTYALVGENDYFSVDAASGVISLRKELDRERHRTHALRVAATDNAQPPSQKNSSATVNIVVLDDNDHHPVSEVTSRVTVINKSSKCQFTWCAMNK